ncbi:ralA-binding protein 1 [Aplysia californica]|uniref:RalA-binding protein 1 n=1 Tax=Aplysia californica TaxID=6500 RepID=A0ABM0K1P8_APLCA|nr:ralA-binding protein 1 [Aplysia californica]
MNFESQDPDVEDDRKRDSSRKRDGKRDKKEKGYQMFEEEDSEDDQLVLAGELKSPSKNKKERVKPTFKFPVRKEKAKEKEEKKDKEAKKEEKEKRREEKEGKKFKKDKKKSKHAPAPAVVTPSQYENPIFGVPLAMAVERNKSHDGIEVPAIVRECIDYIEECGLSCEGIYRISGVKSKVQHLKDAYNRHEAVYLYEHEPNVVASLLKQFLRDLPEPVLTPALLPKFEEASVIKNSKKKVEAFYRLICDMPNCNRLLLSWMIVHMSHVIELAKENKMSLQNVSIVLSPTMQISHRVLYVLFSNVQDLFGNVTLRKYVPPLKPAHSKWSLELPDNPVALEEELAKQESLLNQLHVDLNSGLTDPVIEEQLWEVQRVVTQLKRKIKMAKKNVEMGERRKANLDMKKSSTTSIPSLSAPEELQLELRTAPDSTGPTVTTVTAVVERHPKEGEEVKESPSVDGTAQVDDSKKAVKFAEEPKMKGGETAEKKETEAPKKKKESVSFEEKGKGDMGSEDKKENVTEQKEPTPESKELATKETSSEKVASVGSGKVKEITKEKTGCVTAQAVKEGKEEKDEVKTQVDSVKKGVDETLKVEENLSGESETKQDENVSVALNEKSAVKQAVKPSETTVVAQDNSVKPAERPVVNERKKEPSPPEVTSPSHVKEVTLPQKTVQLPQSVIVKKPPEDKVVSSQASPPKQNVEVEAKKPKLPPFMSTTLLQPMKAEIPKPKSSSEDLKAKQESLLRWEKLRELEEELLGEKKKKVVTETESIKDTEEEISDDRDMEQLLEEEYAMLMEEEELLAIADELKQKMATERSEMERLAQEIQELQYLRQDSDLEDLSSSSNSSDDSEDEEDLQDLLTQLIQDNEDLEMQSADLCQKVHEERMICLSVKLQIRLLQQRQMETTYG